MNFEFFTYYNNEIMADIELDVDEVLNLEEEYYQKGFLEGQEHSTREQYIEGKEYGYQTGFQRALIVGYIQGLMEYWKENKDLNNVDGHMTQLREIVEGIPVTNGESEVAEFEKRINKARNKIRVIATILKESSKVSKLDELMKEMGGTLQVSENVDEMW